MRSELHHIEKIEQFLANKLPQKEQEAMQKRMQQDSQFRAEVDFQAQLIAQIKESAFLDDIKAYHQTYLAGQPKASGKRYWWVIGLLIGVMAVGVVAWLSRPPVEGVDGQVILEKSSKSDLIPIPPTQFEVPFQQISVRNSKGATIQLKGVGSVLHIPSNAVLLPNDNPVEGEYTIQYRSYNNEAQIAFSGIAMQQKQERFSSVGMLEVRAIQNGKILQINPEKPITVDFELLERKEGLSLYHFEQQDSTWATVASIELPSLKRIPSKQELIDIAYNKKIEKILEAQAKADSLNNIVKTPINDSMSIDINGQNISVGATMMPENIDKRESPKSDPDSTVVNKVLYKRRKIVRHKHNPKLVKGLQLSSFGIYNCGQQYTLQNQILVEASYTTQDKLPIQDGHTLSVIDLDYNAAYSFEPSSFLCNRAAANIFLLWTNEGKLYSFYKSSRQKMGNKPFGTFAFAMDDLTAQIQTLEELQAYIDARRANLVN